MTSASGKGRRGLGRPPKFPEPTRVVTLTLPERTLADLARIDPDRGKAIVKAAERTLALSEADAERVDLMEVGPGAAVITVPFVRSLAAIEGVQLIEILPSRYLVIIEPDRALAEVELAVVDRLEAPGAGAGADECRVLRRFLDHLRAYRRSDRTRLSGVILVATDA